MSAPATSDTFIDAFGRCYIAGQEVPQPVYERYVRTWFDSAEVIARLWRLAASPEAEPEESPAVLLDPPLTAAQCSLVDDALAAFPEDSDGPAVSGPRTAEEAGAAGDELGLDDLEPF